MPADLLAIEGYNRRAACIGQCSVRERRFVEVCWIISCCMHVVLYVADWAMGFQGSSRQQLFSFEACMANRYLPRRGTKRELLISTHVKCMLVPNTVSCPDGGRRLEKARLLPLQMTTRTITGYLVSDTWDEGGWNQFGMRYGHRISHVRTISTMCLWTMLRPEFMKGGSCWSQGIVKRLGMLAFSPVVMSVRPEGGALFG